MGRARQASRSGTRWGFLQTLCRLPDLLLDEEVLAVYELTVTGSARRSGLCLQVAHCFQIVDALPTRRRPRGAGDPAAEALDEDGSGACDSDASLAARDEVDAKDTDSGSACSVDTDVDEIGEALLKPKAKLGCKGAPDFGSALAALESDSAGSAAEEEVEAEKDGEMEGGVKPYRGPRLPAGTWAVWQNPWFYITQTAGYMDIKISIRGVLRTPQPVGMGTSLMSKTLRPYVYGESVDDCPKTMVLLQAWAIWRACWDGWPKEKESWQREVDRQLLAPEAGVLKLSASPPATPLLDNAESHAFFRKCVA